MGREVTITIRLAGAQRDLGTAGHQALVVGGPPLSATGALVITLQAGVGEIQGEGAPAGVEGPSQQQSLVALHGMEAAITAEQIIEAMLQGCFAKGRGGFAEAAFMDLSRRGAVEGGAISHQARYRGVRHPKLAALAIGFVNGDQQIATVAGGVEIIEALFPLRVGPDLYLK